MSLALRPLFALAAFAIASLPSRSAGQSQPDTRLDVGSAPGAANSDSVRVACSGENVCVVWRDQRNGALSDIYFNFSRDGGESWGQPDQRLCGGAPGAASSTEPRLCMQGQVVHVVWKELASPGHDVHYRRSVDGGASFGPIARLDLGDLPGASDCLDVQIACEGSLVCAVWSDARNNIPGLIYDIYANRSLDGGATWLPSAVRIDTGDAPGTNQSLRPAIAISAGDIHVAWEDVRGVTVVGPDIYYNRSGDGGATWLAQPTRLDIGSPAGTERSMNVVLGADGLLVCAAWQDQRNGAYDIYAITSFDRGVTWAPNDARLDTSSVPGASVSVDPRLAVTGGAIYVVWRDTAIPGVVNPDVRFQRSLDTGLTWLPLDVQLDDAAPSGATSTMELALAADLGEVFVAWSEASAGFHDITFDRSLDFGSTWLPSEVRVDSGDLAGATDSRHVALATSAHAVHAVWQDRRASPSRYDIYHALVRGFRRYGSGSAGAGGFVPALSGSGEPQPGGAIALALAAARGGAPAVLLFSTSVRAFLPFDFGVIYVAPPWTQLHVMLGGAPGAAGAGTASIAGALPRLPAMLGQPIRMQAAVFDPAAVGSIALSPALELWVL